MTRHRSAKPVQASLILALRSNAEATAEWSASGPENRGRVMSARGSIPLVSAKFQFTESEPCGKGGALLTR